MNITKIKANKIIEKYINSTSYSPQYVFHKFNKEGCFIHFVYSKRINNIMLSLFEGERLTYIRKELNDELSNTNFYCHDYAKKKIKNKYL